MKYIVQNFFIVVQTKDISREEIEKFQGQTFNSLDELYEQVDVETLEAYTPADFIEAINDGDLEFGTNWVILVHSMVEEPRYAVIDNNGNVVKANVNNEGVERYLQGKDSTQYNIEALN
jgi:hypothetical protein